MFWNKDKHEVAKIQQQLFGLVARIEALEHRLDVLVTNQNSLRGLVNKKVFKSDDDEGLSGMTKEQKDFFVNTIEYQQMQKNKSIEDLEK